MNLHVNNWVRAGKVNWTDYSDFYTTPDQSRGLETGLQMEKRKTRRSAKLTEES